MEQITPLKDLPWNALLVQVSTDVAGTVSLKAIGQDVQITDCAGMLMMSYSQEHGWTVPYATCAGTALSASVSCAESAAHAATATCAEYSTYSTTACTAAWADVAGYACSAAEASSACTAYSACVADCASTADAACVAENAYVACVALTADYATCAGMADCASTADCAAMAEYSEYTGQLYITAGCAAYQTPVYAAALSDIPCGALVLYAY